MWYSSIEEEIRKVFWEDPGQTEWFWMSKMWVQDFGNASNQEHRGFYMFGKAKLCLATLKTHRNICTMSLEVLKHCKTMQNHPQATLPGYLEEIRELLIYVRC